MGAGRVLYKLSISIIAVLFISLILTTETDKNLAHDASSIFVMTEAHVRTFPSRNSGMKRRQCSTGIKSPSCKVNAGIKLMKLSLGASYLVLLAGDVSLNPGPIIDPCAVCKKGCKRNQRAVQCDECDLWYHAKCTGITNEDYKSIAQPRANWSCNDCLFPGLDGSVSSEQFAENSTAAENSVKPNKNICLLRGLRIAHLNVNRLVNIRLTVSKNYFPSILSIFLPLQTWLTPDINNDEIYISGYSIIRRDRQNIVKSCGGGTLVFVRDSIPFVVNSDLINNNTDFESIWLELRRPYCERLTLHVVHIDLATRILTSLLCIWITAQAIWIWIIQKLY